jgi:hypothetical protein
MLEKELLLNDLQEQLKNTDNEGIKIIINNIIADVVTGKYNVRTW